MDKNAAVLPISVVTQITDLTPRQVRYYEQQGLINPTRTTGKQRLFSFQEVEQLFQIKELIEKGVNIAGIKEMLPKKPQMGLHQEKAVVQKEKSEELSERGLREFLKRERIHPTRAGMPHLTHGELSRFYRKNNL